MSKIGKQPINLPQDVSVDVSGSIVTVKGTRGALDLNIPRKITLKINKEDNELIVEAKDSDKKTKALHGTIRSILANMVHGVTEGWTKTLELVGTGYRVELKQDTLVITVGYSHPVEYKAPEGINFSVEKLNITVEGIDKELVGLVAAQIRSIRPPEPYKGKGIKYQDEQVRRKAGKAVKAAE